MSHIVGIRLDQGNSSVACNPFIFRRLHDPLHDPDETYANPVEGLLQGGLRGLLYTLSFLSLNSTSFGFQVRGSSSGSDLRCAACEHMKGMSHRLNALVL